MTTVGSVPPLINPAVGVVLPIVNSPVLVHQINQSNRKLNCIGCIEMGWWARVIVDAFSICSNILEMNKKYVTELSTSFGHHTATNGCINFGIYWTKKLMHVMHLVQDAVYVPCTLNIGGSDQVSMLRVLDISGERADASKKNTLPDPLVSGNVWIDWGPKLPTTYLILLVWMVYHYHILTEKNISDCTSTSYRCYSSSRL